MPYLQVRHIFFFFFFFIFFVFWLLSSVSTSFFCPPSLSENAGQNKWSKMPYLQPKRLLSSRVHFVQKWYGRWVSWVFCENTCLYRLSAAEENNKKQNAESKKIRTKSRNGTEISAEWRIAQCMKQILSYSITLFMIFKQRDDFSFLFLLKSWENAQQHFVLLLMIYWI